MVYKQIAVAPRHHGSCMGRRNKNIAAFHPWFPASDVMQIDDGFKESWLPFGRFPLPHLMRNRATDPTWPFGMLMFSREPESQMWRHVIHCGNAYKPEEFSVKLENGALEVSARHERVSHDESSKDVQEVTRRIKVPDNLDTESIKCALRDNGDMVICANWQTEVTKAKSGEGANKDSNNEETLVPETNTSEQTSEKCSDCLTEMKSDSSLSAVGDEASQSFSMDMPISGFKPSEVTVTCRGRTLTMCGEKNEESDHGTTYQKWRRQILLPPDVDVERLNCHLAQDGQLRLCAPKSASEQSNLPQEIDVPVVIEGPENKKEDKMSDEMEH